VKIPEDPAIAEQDKKKIANLREKKRKE